MRKRGDSADSRAVKVASRKGVSSLISETGCAEPVPPSVDKGRTGLSMGSLISIRRGAGVEIDERVYCSSSFLVPILGRCLTRLDARAETFVMKAGRKVRALSYGDRTPGLTNSPVVNQIKNSNRPTPKALP